MLMDSSLYFLIVFLDSSERLSYRLDYQFSWLEARGPFVSFVVCHSDTGVG
jgi:hypothetical protein